MWCRWRWFHPFSLQGCHMNQIWPPQEPQPPDYRDLFMDRHVAQARLPRVLPGKDLLFSLWKWPLDHLWMSHLLPNGESKTGNEVKRSLQKKREIEPWLHFNCYCLPTSPLKSTTRSYSYESEPPLLFFRLIWMIAVCCNQRVLTNASF